MRLKTLCTASAVVLMASASAFASQLTYTPINPTFGGNPFNGSFLLSTANSNNFRYLTNPNAPKPSAVPTAASSASQFRDIVTSALLGTIAQQISNDILGQNAMQSGSFNVGGELINFNRQGGQVNITLTDPTSGGTTNISVPIPQY